MAPLDLTEYERWIHAADTEARVAGYNHDGGFFHTAVTHAEQAAQCALKALLHGVGRASQARGHGLVRLADSCMSEAGLELAEPDRQALAGLSRDYLPSRYPDALPEGTPDASYGTGDASEARRVAERLIDLSRATWDRLIAAEDPWAGGP